MQTCCLQLNPTLTRTHRQLSINRPHADLLSPTQSNSHWHSSTTVNQQTTHRHVVSNSIQFSLALIDNCQSTEHMQTCCLQLNPTLTRTHRQLSINRPHTDLLSPTLSTSHWHSSTTVYKQQQTTPCSGLREPKAVGVRVYSDAHRLLQRCACQLARQCTFSTAAGASCGSPFCSCHWTSRPHHADTHLVALVTCPSTNHLQTVHHDAFSVLRSGSIVYI